MKPWLQRWEMSVSCALDQRNTDTILRESTLDKFVANTDIRGREDFSSQELPVLGEVATSYQSHLHMKRVQLYIENIKKPVPDSQKFQVSNLSFHSEIWGEICLTLEI